MAPPEDVCTFMAGWPLRHLLDAPVVADSRSSLSCIEFPLGLVRNGDQLRVPFTLERTGDREQLGEGVLVVRQHQIGITVVHHNQRFEEQPDFEVLAVCVVHVEIGLVEQHLVKLYGVIPFLDAVRVRTLAHVVHDALDQVLA